MNILWASNAPWCASGYGIQSKSLLPRLKSLPAVDEVSIFAWFGLQGGAMSFTAGHNGVAHSFRVLPASGRAYGNGAYQAYCRLTRADILVTLIDAWVLEDLQKLVAPTKWLPWFPVDHEPLPGVVREAVANAYLPLTYSQWGHRVAMESGIASAYIPHGVEPDEYCILPADEVQAFRRAMFGDAPLVCSMVAANKGWPSRKGFEEVMQAWVGVLRECPQARLYIHSFAEQEILGGGDLQKLAAALGIDHSVSFPNSIRMWVGGYSAHDLALIYNASDVFLSPSKSEGFGIPIIEAQACGCPVVVTDFSAMPELVRWGVAVAPDRLTWAPMPHMNAWQAMPDVAGVLSAIMELWQGRRQHSPASLEERRRETSNAIHREYGWDGIVTNYWSPLLNQLSEV